MIKDNTPKKQTLFMRVLLVFLLVFLVGGSIYSTAEAHKTVNVDKYAIEVGWDVEPPIVGFRNAITYEISESPSPGVKSGVINAFKNLEATIKMGGESKVLDIDSDPSPGNYLSKIIPTKTGSLVIELKGEINGIPVDVDIPVEDVESTAILDFPQSSGSSSGQEVTSLKNAMTSLQKDVTDIKSKISGINKGSIDFNSGNAYNFGVFGLSLGAAGVILAIIAMVKRK